MAYLLDTNIAIALRDGVETIHARIGALDDAVLFSALTRAELEGGVYRDPSQTTRRRAFLDTILEAVPVLPFDNACAEEYGRIVSLLGYSRRQMIDRMIAAQAIVAQATLITLNSADFEAIPGLRFESWPLD